MLVSGAAAFEGGSLSRLLWAAGSAALIGGGANGLNDACDLDVDRVNRPGRPLPAGQATPRAAWIVWGVATTAGIGVSVWLSWPHVVTAVTAAALLYTYNVRWKHIPGLGNAVVALVTGLVLTYGGMAVGPAWPALVGAAFAFLVTLAREIVKDVQDAQGDAATGGRTLPLVWGAGAAWQSAAGVVALTVALTPAPYLALGYPGAYLLGVVLADAALLRAMGVCASTPTPERAERASRLLKGAMALGMMALAVAGLLR
jgi:geranylgeranylglycerol-phosphate geranylgeranyltransferase